MNLLNRQLFYRSFHGKLEKKLGRDKARKIWDKAGEEYDRILSLRPELKRHNGAMTIPAVALYRTLAAAGEDAEVLLNQYGEDMGKRFAGIIHALTSLPGVDILSCPYHEMAKELGCEKAVLCICHMDKEYSKGFRHIRYDRNSAVSEGARACEYRLRFDPEKP